MIGSLSWVGIAITHLRFLRIGMCDAGNVDKFSTGKMTSRLQPKTGTAWPTTPTSFNFHQPRPIVVALNTLPPPQSMDDHSAAGTAPRFLEKAYHFIFRHTLEAFHTLENDGSLCAPLPP